MKFQIVEHSELHFPRDEWRWLRTPVLHPMTAETDAFVWAAKVGESLWAWHPSGAELRCDSSTSPINALVLETDGTELEAHGLYLKTTFASGAGAHDSEWVAAIRVLTDRLQFDPAANGLPRYWKEALEACGLEAHLGVLAQRGRYVFLGQSELQLMFDRRWDLATLELLESVPSPIRETLIENLKKWNISASSAKEAVNLAMILSKKMGDKTAVNILNGKYGNAEEFRMALLTTAQPEFALLTQKRIERMRGLQVPPRTAVHGDPSFEKDLLKITHNPRNMADFSAFKAWVENPTTAEKIRALLEIYQ